MHSSLERVSLEQDICAPRDFKGDYLSFKRASGSVLISEDDTEFYDLINGKGSVLLGHNPPELKEKLISFIQGDRDVRTGFHESINVVSKHLCDLCKSESVAFFKTGSSAAVAASRALQNLEDKKIVLSSGYHGYDPYWHADHKNPNNHGIIDFFYDLDLLRENIRKFKNQIAGIVLSPDYIYLPKKWYEEFFNLIDENNIKLISDEIKQGLRINPPISIERYGYKPYASLLSKGLANGHPISAVIGPKSLLMHLKYHTYTAFFDPLGFCATEFVLGRLKDGSAQAYIKSNTIMICNYLNKSLKDNYLNAKVAFSETFFQFIFEDLKVEAEFYKNCLCEGILLYEFDNQTISAAYSGKDIRNLLKKFDQAIKATANASLITAQDEVSSWAIYQAAWRLIDGLPWIEGDSFNKRRLILNRLQDEL